MDRNRVDTTDLLSALKFARKVTEQRFIGSIGLPPHVGSQFQVEWAVEPRADLCAMWENCNVQVVDQPPSTSEGYTVVLASKDYEETLGRVGIAANYGGNDILVVASNELGGTRYQKLFKDSFTREAESKAHFKILFLSQTEELKKLIEHAKSRKNGEGFWTQPGLFSSDKIDVGSKLLADSLPKLTGNGADICSGIGYLGIKALEKGGESVALLEVDKRAIEISKININDSGFAEKASYHWLDLLEFKTDQKFDWIVMNPPYHNHGGRQDVSLGERCILKGAQLLAKDGDIFVVALTSNNYKKVLQEVFKVVEEISSSAGFSTYRASGQKRIENV